MILNDASRARWAVAGRLLDRLPEDTYVFISDGPSIQLVADKQAELRAYRAFFPGSFWKKDYAAWCKTWYYRTHRDGVEIVISCQEQPPTCTRIVKKKTVVKKVPVTFEECEVEEEEVTFDCSGEGEGDIEAVAGADHADDVLPVT